MANKRVSELVEITAQQLAADDLLLLADVTAQESKKLKMAELNAFMLATSNSGSFYGTASWAQYAVYALSAPTPVSVSYAATSTNTVNAENSTFATSASFASASITTSYAITASYAHTSSVLLIYSAAFSDYAKTASYLLYTGIPNGTSSFSLTSSLTRGTASYALSALTTMGTASYSNTASFALFSLYTLNTGSAISSVLYALSASWASASVQASIATQSLSSSYINYSGIPNGTASYALVAGQYPSARVNYGVYSAITQSSFCAQLDRVNITAPIGGISSSFEAVGSVIIPFTSSVYATCSIELIALDRWTGITSSLDRAPLNVSLQPIAIDTGSILVPFSLMGEHPLSGSIMVYVTASGGARIDQNRPVKFDITSLGQGVQVTTYETMSLRVIQNMGLPPTFAYTSSGVLTYGVDSDCYAAPNVTEIDVSNLSLWITKYVWLMPDLIKFNASNNSFLVDVGGMPSSLISMSVQNCAISMLAPLNYNSALKYLDCSYNNISSLPSLPSGLWYLNCMGNSQLTRLPSSLPSSLIFMNASETSITSAPLFMPNTLISMSVATNTSLVGWSTAFPSSLGMFDCHGTSLTTLPVLPYSLRNLNISDCLFSSAQIEYITTQLVNGGLTGGYLNTSGNGVTYTSTTLTNFSTLGTRGWVCVI
jgi:hypothetical protein